MVEMVLLSSAFIDTNVAARTASLFWLRAGRGRLEHATVSHGGWQPARPVRKNIIDPCACNTESCAASDDISC